MICQYCGKDSDRDTDILLRFEPYDHEAFDRKVADHEADYLSGAYVCFGCAEQIAHEIQVVINHRIKLAKLKTDQFTVDVVLMEATTCNPSP